MKKHYNFLAVLMTAMMFFGMSTLSAQTVVLSENFDALNELGGNHQGDSASSTALVATDLDTYTQTPGWTGDKMYPAYGKMKLGTATALGWFQTPVIDLSGNNGNFVIHFKSMAWSGDSTKLKIYVNGDVTIVPGLSNSAAYTMSDFDVYCTGGTAATTIKFEGLQAAKGRFFLDDIVIEINDSPAISCNANLDFGNVRVNDPVTENLTVRGFNLTAGGTTTVAISGAEFTTTTTTLNNTDLLSQDGVVLPITFSAATVGNYTGTLTFSNSDLATDKVVNLSAVCVSFTEVATLAELRALYDISNITVNTTDAIIYKYTGEAVVTAVTSYRNQKCIQDETAALFIYDQGEIITTPLAVGDKITGVYGKLTNYFGYLEYKPQFNIDRKISSYNDVTPLEITLQQLQDTAFQRAHQSELMYMTDVTFVSTGDFASLTRYVVSQGGIIDTAIATLFSDVDYIGQPIPLSTETITIVGINYFTSRINGVPYPARNYIIPRSTYDFVGIAENNSDMNTVKVYPNPTTDNVVIELSENINATHVNIYDVFGKLAGSQSLNNNDNVVSMSNLTSGVYFLRIFNDNAIVGTAKIIKK